MGLFSQEKVNLCPGTDKCVGCKLWYAQLRAQDPDTLYTCFHSIPPSLDVPQNGIRLCVNSDKGQPPKAICDAVAIGDTAEALYITDRKSRQQGLASLLLSKMKEQLKKAGVRQIVLNIEPYNAGSRAVAVKGGAHLKHKADAQTEYDEWEIKL